MWHFNIRLYIKDESFQWMKWLGRNMICVCRWNSWNIEEDAKLCPNGPLCVVSKFEARPMMAVQCVAFHYPLPNWQKKKEKKRRKKIPQQPCETAAAIVFMFFCMVDTPKHCPMDNLITAACTCFINKISARM